MAKLFLADRVDVRLLEALYDDGRASNRHLADQVGLSESACSARMRQLTANGIIAGFRAELAFERLGAFQAWVDVRLVDNRPTTMAAFEALALAAPEVERAYISSSEPHFRLRVVTENYAACQALLQRLGSHANLVRDLHGHAVHKISEVGRAFPGALLTRLFEQTDAGNVGV